MVDREGVGRVMIEDWDWIVDYGDDGDEDGGNGEDGGRRPAKTILGC